MLTLNTAALFVVEFGLKVAAIRVHLHNEAAKAFNSYKRCMSNYFIKINKKNLYLFYADRLSLLLSL